MKGSLDNPISQFISFLVYLGREIVGEIEQAGERAKDFLERERVAVYPILSCEPRGISPPRAACQVETCRLADYGRALKNLLDKGDSRLVKAAIDHRKGREKE